MCIGPPLLPLNGEIISSTSAIHSDEACADVCATGFRDRPHF